MQLKVVIFLFFIKEISGSSFAHFYKVDKAKDVCKDVYKHFCTKWMIDNKKPSSEPVWNQFTLVSKLINHRIQMILETGKVTNANIFYNQCIQSTTENYSEQLRYIVDLFGSWSDLNAGNYNFFNQVIEVKKLLGLHAILKVHVETDYEVANHSALYIDPAPTILPEIILLAAKENKMHITAYKKWIINSVKSVYKSHLIENVADMVHKIVNFEIALASLMDQKYSKQKVTINQLSTILNINGKYAVEFLFEGTNIDVKSLKYIITQPEYLLNLIAVIDKFEANIISNYIMWSIIKDFSRHTSSNLRQLNFEIDKEILGIQEDLNRKDECTQNTLKFFSSELTSQYINVFMDPHIFKQASKMAHLLKLQFLKDISNMSFSKRAKQLFFSKVSDVHYEIGFPKYDYNSRQVELGENYFISIIKLKKHKSSLELEELSLNTIRWPSHAFEVNAFYNILQNVIVIPLGILHNPFFSTKNTRAQNYGALGSLIGHELAHSLENVKNLPSEDLMKIIERKKCMTNEVNDPNIINELKADIVGLNLSTKTFFNGKVSTVNETNNLFTAFGQLWCEVNGDTLFIDEHPPVHLRVSEVLKNFNLFSNLYGCKKKHHKCDLW